jgi:hypothetical protein
MILLLNLLVPLLVIAHVYLAYKLNKLWPIGLGFVIVMVYTVAQPSYMPKGTVKPLPNAEFRTVDKPIVDLGLKPKSGDEYDAERNNALDEIDNSINEQIKLNKQ